jgi:hypothetical protein
MEIFFDFSGETNVSHLLSFLEETEGLLQRLIIRDKQLKDFAMKVRSIDS